MFHAKEKCSREQIRQHGGVGQSWRSKTHTERFKLVWPPPPFPFPLEALVKTSVCVSVCVFVCACERAYTHVHMQELGGSKQIRTEICTDFPEILHEVCV